MKKMLAVLWFSCHVRASLRTRLQQKTETWEPRVSRVGWSSPPRRRLRRTRDDVTHPHGPLKRSVRHSPYGPRYLGTIGCRLWHRVA